MLDAHVIVRSAGERTTEAACWTARMQAAGLELTVIKEAPFEEALRMTYLHGLKAGRKWTITLDADVLLMEGAALALVQAAEALPSHYVQLEGRIFDYVTGLFRQAGHRIYRTEFLGEALKLIPRPGTEIRPEFATLCGLARRGRPSWRIARVMGVHDAEQAYADLYRTCVVHAKKIADWIPLILARCDALGPTNSDFAVVRRALADGASLRERISIDHRLFVDAAVRALDDLGLVEKPPIADPQKLAEEVFSGRTAYFNAADAEPMSPYEMTVPDVTPLPARLAARFRQLGLMKGGASLVESAGRRLRKLAFSE